MQDLTLKLEKVYVELCGYIYSAFQFRSCNQIISDAEGEAAATTAAAGQKEDYADEDQGKALRNRAAAKQR